MLFFSNASGLASMPAGRFVPRVLAVLVAMSLPISPVSAQTTKQQAQRLAPVVVTATRSPEAAVNLINDIDVMDTDAMRQRGAFSLNEGLGMMSGITVTANGGPASTGSLFLRGASGGQTLTLIDGFRVSSVALGQPVYEALPMSLADRVEVLRGPGSSLYGADALGGVIQLLSPRGDVGRPTFGELAIGGDSTRRAIASAGGAGAKWSGAIRLSREQSDGYDVTRPAAFGANPDRDGYTRDGVVGSVRTTLGPDTDLRLVLLRSELETDFDDGDFSGARTVSTTTLGGLTLTHEMADETLLEFKFGRTTDRSRSVSSFASVVDSTQDQLSLTGRREVSPDVQLLLGYELLRQDVDNTSYAIATAPTRKTNSVFALLSGREGAHILQLGVRRDDSDQYGSQTNMNFSYGYALSSALRIGGTWASGFRAPGFNDLYFPGYGRSVIKPEQSKNVEVGVYWDQRSGSDRSGWHGKLVAYTNRVRDLVVYAPVCPDPDPQFAFGCADNINKARLSGLSLTMGKQFGALSFSLNADLMDPQDETLDKLLARRARQKLSLALGYEYHRYRLGMAVRTRSGSFEDPDNTRRLGGFTTLNLSGRMQLAPAWQAFLSVTNATDKDYETAAGYRPQGRLVMLGVRYQPQ